MAWEDIDSSNHESDCGSNAPNTPQAMLDGTNAWFHITNEVHNLVIDLNSSKLVTKIRTKSNGVAGNLPNDVDIFVSDNLGDFGVAVETGIDISSDSPNVWTERILTTQKTGRYIKIQINTTSSANNFLGWGADDQKVLDFFTGAIPKRWYSVINLTAFNFGTNSTSFVPTDGSICLLDWDGSKYSNIVAAYFETTGAVSGTEPISYAVQLYDRTNVQEVASMSSLNSALNRTPNIVDDLPSGNAVLDVRIASNSGGTTAALKSARLIIVQEEDSVNKTRVYLPVGQRFAIIGTTYQSGSGELSAIADCEHQYKWLDDNFENIENAYYHAVIKRDGSATASAKLDSVDEDDSISVLNSTSSSPELLISSDISGSLTNTTLYTSYIKNTDGRATTTMINAWIVVDLNPLRKFEFTYDVCAFGKKETTNTGWQIGTEYQLTYNTGDIWCFDCDSENTIHAVVSGHNIATNIRTAVYDDGVIDNSSVQIETSSGANYNEDDSIAHYANDSNIKAGWNVFNTVGAAYGNLWMHNLLVQIDIGVSVETYNKNFTTDAFLQEKDNNKEFTADSFLQNTFDKTFTTNAILKAQLDKTFSTDAILKKTIDKTFSLDAYLSKAFDKDFSVDSMIRKTLTKTFLVDALIQEKDKDKTFSADALLKSQLDKDFSVDAFIRKVDEKNFSVDSILRKTLDKNFTIDSLLSKEFTKTLTSDAVLTTTGSKTFSADAILEKRTDKTFTVDAVLRSTRRRGGGGRFGKIEKEYYFNIFSSIIKESYMELEIIVPVRVNKKRDLKVGAKIFKQKEMVLKISSKVNSKKLFEVLDAI